MSPLSPAAKQAKLPSFMSASQRHTVAVQQAQHRLWTSILQKTGTWDVVNEGARYERGKTLGPLYWSGYLRELLCEELVPGVAGVTLTCGFHVMDDEMPKQVVIRDIFGHGETILLREEMQAVEAEHHAERIRYRWRQMLVSPPEGLEELLPHLTEAVGFKVGYRTWNEGEMVRWYDAPKLEWPIDETEDLNDVQIRYNEAPKLVSGFRCTPWEPRKAAVLDGPGVGFFARKRVPGSPGPTEGLVALWGDVYEHEGGYRASHAYPYAIIGHKNIADLYGVPCITREQAEAML